MICGVQGIWRFYAGPVGCGKESQESKGLWYLDVEHILQPNPLPIAGNGAVIEVTTNDEGTPQEVPTEGASTGDETIQPTSETLIEVPVTSESIGEQPPTNTPPAITISTLTPTATSVSISATATPTTAGPTATPDDEATAVPKNTSTPTATTDPASTSTPPGSQPTPTSGSPNIPPAPTATPGSGGYPPGSGDGGAYP